MKMPQAVFEAARRFDALTLRERVLVTAGVIGMVFLFWDGALMQPLSAHKSRLSTELGELQNGIADAADLGSTDPLQVAIREQSALKAEISGADASLEAAAAGLIPPQRMIGVVRDVLSRQRGLKLVSLQNGPVTPLSPPLEATEETPAVETGPYVHPVELVVEGSYFDVLSYLRELEALPWRFYWKTFDLSTTQYPTNRVRIELSTLSMERAWLGV
jgi:MSHA biogenesis protein MshJ